MRLSFFVCTLSIYGSHVEQAIRRAAGIIVPTRNVSEGPNKNPSLTFRVGIGRFISAAPLKAYVAHAIDLG